MANYHEKGQKDGANGNYNPPHSSVAEQLAGLLSTTKENERDFEDKRQYDSGYENAKKQR